MINNELKEGFNKSLEMINKEVNSEFTVWVLCGDSNKNRCNVGGDVKTSIKQLIKERKIKESDLTCVKICTYGNEKGEDLVDGYKYSFLIHKMVSSQVNKDIANMFIQYYDNLDKQQSNNNNDELLEENKELTSENDRLIAELNEIKTKYN